MDLYSEKIYLRDGRSLLPKTESISRVMSSNKGINTSPEIIFRKALWNNNIKGYRLHWIKVPGRPDIAFPGKKIAIFVNGCFWHRCPKCNLPLPRTNQLFWKTKFEKNIERDKIKKKKLNELGWKVYTYWECEINKDIIVIIKEVEKNVK